MTIISLLVYCITAFASTTATPAISTLTFDEALEKKLISYKVIRATPPQNLENNTYGNKVWLTLTNRSGENLKIQIDPGMLFQPNDAGYQTMIITKTLTLDLKPGNSASSNIHGMCIHMRRMVAEGDRDTYVYIGKAEEHLTGLAILIEKFDAQDNTGQMAVWSWTDDQNLSNIEHPDPKVQAEFHKFIAKAKDWPLTNDKRKSISIQDREYLPVHVQRGEFIHYISGHFEFALRETSNVGIVMIRPDGSLHKKLYVYDQQAPGSYDVDFDFKEAFEVEGNYSFRLYINGDQKINLKMNISNKG